MSGVENHVTLSTQSASRPSQKTKPMRVAQERRKREVEKRQVHNSLLNTVLHEKPEIERND
jgi:hypothetical protein